MSFAFLAAPVAPEPTTPGIPQPELTLTLMSLDGGRRIVLDGSSGFTHMPGSTGLEMPPFDIVTTPLPGVPGSALQDVRVEERRIFLPIFVGTGTGSQLEHLLRMDDLRSIVDPLTGRFRIVGSTTRTQRELLAVYLGGLEGDDSEDANGLIWNKVGLTALACEPFARSRTDRVVEFSLGAEGGPFIGAVGGSDAIWPTSLGTSSVIGDNMRVAVASEVPVYPTVELIGPMDSFSATMSLENSALPPYFGGSTWSVSIPTGVPEGSTLRIVTDPRARSIRLGTGDPAETPGWTGALAAGRVARGSTLRPFYPGVNVMDVVAPGATAETRVRISWRELFRSLW